VRRTRITALAGGIAVLALALALVSGGAAKTTTKSASPMVACLVTDIGGLNDHGFNHLAYVGLVAAHKKLHVNTYVLQSKSPNDYIPNFSTCVSKYHANLVIGVGFLMESSIQTMAKKYPSTKWAGVDMNAKTDFTKGGITPNFEGLIFAENEVGYEAGYIAALMAQNDKSTTVSSVGGIPVPAVVRYIAGYQAGAKKAVPSITVLNGYSQDFVAQDKCKNIALDQISKGSDVVFQVAGGCGLGVLDAAKEKSVWGIGVDADQAYVNQRVLTSAQKKVDVAVYTAIANLQKGKFASASNLLFNAANGGVGLGIINKAVPTSIRLKTRAISLLVAHGVIRPPTACAKPNPNC
jgi:basic membrane protein A and related proteins